MLCKDLIQSFDKCGVGVFVFCHYSPNLNFILLQQSSHLSFELSAIVALKYFGINERTNLVNVGNHFSHIFSLFCSRGSSDFVSGSDIDSRQGNEGLCDLGFVMPRGKTTARQVVMLKKAEKEG